MSLATGTRLGAYEILGRLGSGAMGTVYRARDTRLGRDVAIKVLPPSIASDPVRRARFEREARAASALNHPNIVTVHDFDSTDGASFLVLEHIEGSTLRELAGNAPMRLQRMLPIATQIADGLARAHAAGIIHRDLKPENVMVTRDGLVKVLDFGLAKVDDTASQATQNGDGDTLALGDLDTQPGVVMGTLAYMSPEQAAGKPLDFRSDQFSLGLILYELATGRRTFQRGSAGETLAALMRDEPEPLAKLVPELPVPLRWVIERCLAKDARDRYASTFDLARDLRRITEALADASLGSPMAGQPAGRKRRLPRLRPILGLAAAATLGATIHALATHRTAAPADPPWIEALTHSGHDYSPAASPDGRTVAFTSDRDGLPRIWLKQVKGGSEVALSSGSDDFARFSPDGASILFSRTEAGRVSLYRMPTVGGDARLIFEDGVDGDWSPDGQHVALVSRRLDRGGSVTRLLTADLDGSDLHEIARFENRRVSHPRWSPDGRLLAVTAGGSAGGVPSAIMLVPAKGGEPRSLQPLQNRGQLSAVAWDGSTAIVYSQASSVAGATSGSTARLIRQELASGAATALAWSPNNSEVLDVLGPGRVVFDGRSPRESLRELPLRPEGTPRGEGRWLTRGSSTDRQPVYSPDGEWVAFSSNRSGNLDVWAVSTRTAAIRRLTDDPAEDWDPAFTHDGRLLWSSNRGGHFEIWSAEADGHAVRQLSRDGVSAENPTATPDGAWIVYATGQPERSGIFKIHPDGSEATRLVAGITVWPEVSPDGKHALYVTGTPDSRTIHAVRLADGQVLPFTISLPSPINTATSLGRARWLPGGSAIAFIGQDERGRMGIFAQDFAADRDTTGSRRALGGFDAEAATESFAIAPDGSRMTVASWEQLFSVMVAEGLPGIAHAGRE